MKRDGEVFRVCYFRSGWEETLNVEVPQRLTAERANLFLETSCQDHRSSSKKGSGSSWGEWGMHMKSIGELLETCIGDLYWRLALETCIGDWYWRLVLENCIVENYWK